MLRRLSVLAIAFCCLAGLSGASLSHAQVFGSIPEEQSVLDYGWQGLLLGSVAGLAVGYIDNRGADTGDLLKNVANGSVIGTGVGLIVGFADLSDDKSGIGAVIMHDMRMGSLLGLALGTIWGGVAAINQEDISELGAGASWGFLGGLALGLGVAMIEGPEVVEGQRVNGPGGTSLSLRFFNDSRNTVVPGVALVRSF